MRFNWHFVFILCWYFNSVFNIFFSILMYFYFYVPHFGQCCCFRNKDDLAELSNLWNSVQLKCDEQPQNPLLKLYQG